MIRRRVVATGRVQGVGFRYSCVQEARSRAVHGWVRNRGDGSLEAALEGEQDAVDAVIEWMRHGPPNAHVAHLAVREEDPHDEHGFTAR